MMTFSWIRRRGARKTEASSKGNINDQDMELTIPTHFRCPISLDLMKDPVTLSTGITYDRDSIDKWIEAGNITYSVTNQELRNFEQIPNHSIRKMIQDWCVDNKSSGIERIPTPRIPITPYEVSDICSKLNSATQRGDAKKCLGLLGKIKDLAEESERNKRCIVDYGIGLALADIFDSFSRISVNTNMNLLKETLSALTWAFPLSGETVAKLTSEVSLHSMTCFLKSQDDLSSRQNAVCVLKEVICGDQDCVDGIMGANEDIAETLCQIVKVPIGPKATKACLVIIRRMMSKSDIITLKFVQMGLIPPILELLVDGDKSSCEKTLAVLDSICSWEQGRESAYNNALTIPLLVKKILCVSNTATELCISSLWKLCLGENENVAAEAAQLGAFQKLLVVLQIGSGERTKEKVTELLKWMNLYRDRLDCFEFSVGFKNY